MLEIELFARAWRSGMIDRLETLRRFRFGFAATGRSTDCIVACISAMNQKEISIRSLTQLVAEDLKVH